MRLREAQKLIRDRRTTGYVVTFAWRRGFDLEQDYFPAVNDGEPLLATSEEAYLLAEQFAEALRGEVTNVRVERRELVTVRD